MASTYVNRSADNTNEAVVRKVLEKLNQQECEPPFEQGGQRRNRTSGRKERVRSDVIPSERIKTQAVKLLRKALAAEDGDILRRVTVKDDNQSLRLPQTMRVGRPKHSWLLTTAQEAWRQWRPEGETMEFDHLSQESLKTLLQRAVHQEEINKLKENQPQEQRRTRQRDRTIIISAEEQILRSDMQEVRENNITNNILKRERDRRRKGIPTAYATLTRIQHEILPEDTHQQLIANEHKADTERETEN